MVGELAGGAQAALDRRAVALGQVVEHVAFLVHVMPTSQAGVVGHPQPEDVLSGRLREVVGDAARCAKAKWTSMLGEEYSAAAA